MKPVFTGTQDSSFETGDDAMTRIMTPSAKEITEGQIDKAVANYRALLEKHRGELMSEPAQQVLGQSELAAEQLAVLRKRVEAISNMIVRHVKVDRTRPPQQVLDATGRRQYTTRGVVDAMPHGEGEEVGVHFFTLGRYVSDSELDKEYELRGLKPADPYSLAVVNQDDPAFADERPNGTHWKDADGNWCYAAFYQWSDERGVDVYRSRDDYDWDDYWWFAGVRK